jgi:drug/metabolite transporter (DMT)-like permease
MAFSDRLLRGWTIRTGNSEYGSLQHALSNYPGNYSVYLYNSNVGRTISTQTYRGVIYALAAALLFGASTPAAKLLLNSIDPSLLAGLLYLGSGIGLGLLLLVRRLTGYASSEAPLQRRDVPWLAGAILSGGFLGPLMLMIGLTAITGFAASLLLNMEAVFTIGLAWFVFKEHFDLRIALGAVAIIIGGVLLSIGPEGGLFTVRGGLFVTLACLFWGIDNNLTRQISSGDPIQIAFFKGLIGGLANVLLAVFTTSNGVQIGELLEAGPGLLVEKVSRVPNLAGVDAGAWLYAGIVGLGGYGVSLVFFILALRHIGTARTGAYFSTAPFIGSLLSIVLLSDQITTTLTLAALFMGIGVWLHISEKHAHEHHHEELKHDHSHTHDEHHRHTHSSAQTGESHSHHHQHSTLIHTHPHYPDLHHRHGH